MDSDRRAIAVGIGIVAVLCGLILLSVLTPVHGTTPRTGAVVIGNERYAYENVTVREPGWSNFTFFGVTFVFLAWCAGTAASGVGVCVTVSASMEVFGTIFGFDANSTPMTWFSPDGHEGIIFEPYSGDLARLLVAA